MQYSGSYFMGRSSQEHLVNSNLTFWLQEHFFPIRVESFLKHVIVDMDG